MLIIIFVGLLSRGCFGFFQITIEGEKKECYMHIIIFLLHVMTLRMGLEDFEHKKYSNMKLRNIVIEQTFLLVTLLK